MRKNKSLSHIFKIVKKDVFALMHHIEAAESRPENSKLTTIINAYKKRLGLKFLQLEESQNQLIEELQETIIKKNQQIKGLIKEKESIISDNYLLEYKKKDLMLLAAQLEEANEEIALKNSELAAQKKQIQQQAEELNKSNKKVLRKNDELEAQKEFMLDQADYLEEANKELHKMHSEVEKQKEEILHKNKELVELNTEKNNLIHIVAHDLKSPLNQIKGLISLIKYNPDKLSEETLNYLEIMDGSANRLNEMIAKILDVKAIEAQKLNIKLESGNLSALAKEIAERYSLTAGEKNIHLVEEIESKVFAEVDKGFITQVLENLLSNAIKFSEPHTSIKFQVMEKEGNALIGVVDQGPGMTKEDRKKLCKKFQKLSARPTGNETSTGLGLSIVKQFVEAMGGEIWCESEAGKGAGFYVKLKTLSTRPIQESKVMTI